VVSQRDSAKKEKTFKAKWIYESLGISKQAYYQRVKASKAKEAIGDKVTDWVILIRQRQKRAGGKKLHVMLQGRLREHGVKMGRDKLFDLLRSRGLLVRRTKRFHVTTDSKHHFYKSPNRIKELDITHAEQVLVSDITYIRTDQGHAYLALVTDAYSKKLMGYALEDHMRVELVKKALAMANGNRIHNTQNVIHHSDRGLQYCCPDYSEFAEGMGFVLSTTQQYDPYENAIAERINGILKYEFGLNETLPSLKVAKTMIAEAAEIYNNERLHWSLNLKTPSSVHDKFDKDEYKSYKKRA
jgi:transposase InsO family protein